MKDTIIIAGGSGFLGVEICRQASLRGMNVISISAHGKPRGLDDRDYTNVIWQCADIFNPAAWRPYLTGARALIHCIGIIEERPSQDITYERMIFEAAKIAGDAVKAMHVEKMVYISAGAAAPETPEGYMRMKLAAEGYLIGLDIGLTIVRPGMIYGPRRPETIRENKAIQKLLHDPQVYPGLKDNRPLPVTKVAAAALGAALGNIKQTILHVDDIDTLTAV